MNKNNVTKFTNKESLNEGSSEWMSQRITAVALLIIILWLSRIIFKIIFSGFFETIAHSYHIFDLSMFCLLIGTSLYHGNLGIKVIIEDYIRCQKTKVILLISIKFIAIISFIIFSIGIISMHFFGF